MQLNMIKLIYLIDLLSLIFSLVMDYRDSTLADILPHSVFVGRILGEIKETLRLY